jgi:beta-mannosidase
MKELSLDGQWRLRWSDGQRGKTEFADREAFDDVRAIDAVVPGSVHLDLVRAGLIGDPNNGLNALAARWVEECFWSYRREFEAPPTSGSQANAGRAWLYFEQLDYAARIVLNGQEIAKHANFFRPCRIEITGKLRPGKNILSVHVESGMFAVANKPYEGWPRADDAALTKRTWLRKPQFQFGWDWSTRLINVGISGTVWLEWTDEPVRVEQIVPLVNLSADLARGTCRVRTFLESLSGGEGEVSITASIAGVQPVEQRVNVSSGPVKPFDLTLNIDRPELWWPVGHGKPYCYPLRVVVRVGSTVIADREFAIGFRHVRFNQDAHAVSGSYFKLEINGRPIFCRGGNFVPADMIFARLDQARYETLIDRALEANFNFMRVWGGGLYESDAFYDLCNKHGLLVWQEFIFACDRFPAIDETFHREVVAEARYQVRRLAGHPSLIAWCGNNEIEEGQWHWADLQRGVINPDHAIYHLTLPRLLGEEDPGRYYQPSSPFSPDHADPRADDRGDQHPWTIGFQETDFRKYRQMICRFPNEGGILGSTSLPTTLACLPEGQRHHGSFAWQVHDNSVDTWFDPSPPDEMIKQWTGKNPRELSIEQFVFWAGVVQGEGLTEYIHNFRRRMFDSASAIFWMFNDCWPAVRSWTIVDYALRRTPAFHPVRRAMAPVHVIIVEEGDTVQFIGVNDTPADVHGTLRYSITNFAGGDAIAKHLSVNLLANSATPLAALPKSAWKDPTKQCAIATLHDTAGQLLARNKLLLPFFKEIDWPDAKINVSMRDGRATFICPTFVWRIALDLDGELPLADNFFDLFPGQPYVLDWPHALPPKILVVGSNK